MASSSSQQENKPSMESPFTSLLSSSISKSMAPVDDLWRPSTTMSNDASARPMDLTVVKPEARRPNVPTRPVEEESQGLEDPEDESENAEPNVVDEF